MIAEQIKAAIWDHQKIGNPPPTQVFMSPEKIDQLIYECRDVLVYRNNDNPINSIYGLRIVARTDLPKDVIAIVC